MSELLQDENSLISHIQENYCREAEITGGQSQQALLVAKQQLPDFMQRMKAEEDCRFNMLRSLAGVDYGEYLELVYHLYSLPLRQGIIVKTRCDSQEAQVPTVTGIWPSANFQEREIYDLLGVEFTGHPDLRRILLPDTFDGHPLRKSFTTGGKR